MYLTACRPNTAQDYVASNHFVRVFNAAVRGVVYHNTREDKANVQTPSNIPRNLATARTA